MSIEGEKTQPNKRTNSYDASENQLNNSNKSKTRLPPPAAYLDM